MRVIVFQIVPNELKGWQKKALGALNLQREYKNTFLLFFKAKRRRGYPLLFLIYRDCMTKLCPHSFLETKMYLAPWFLKVWISIRQGLVSVLLRSQTINGIIDFVELSLIVALPIDKLPRQETNPCRLTSFSLFMICLHKHLVPAIFHIYTILHTYIVYHVYSL